MTKTASPLKAEYAAAQNTKTGQWAIEWISVDSVHFYFQDLLGLGFLPPNITSALKKKTFKIYVLSKLLGSNKNN